MSLDPRIHLLLDQLDRAVDGAAWHGPSLREVLAEVTAQTAVVRPVAGAHSIWELVLHLTAWTREVLRRLDGATPAMPEPGDWPAVPEPTDAAWETARAMLWLANSELRTAIARLSPAALDERVGSSEEPALGTGQTMVGMLLGLVQHHAYHGGQVALLAKAAASQARADVSPQGDKPASEPYPPGTPPSLSLELLPGRYAVLRYPADADVAGLASEAADRGETPLWSLTRTAGEVSVVVREDQLDASPAVAVERGFVVLAVAGPLAFGLTGILASLANPLAAAGLPIFVISTFDTDLLLVRSEHLDESLAALGAAGHRVDPGASANDGDHDMEVKA